MSEAANYNEKEASTLRGRTEWHGGDLTVTAAWTREEA